MKKLFIIVLGLALVSGTVTAQVNVTIGTAPSWGPVGYPKAHYYYLPDIETYYDVHTNQFISYNGASWVRSKSLPAAYRTYDLNKGHKVVLARYNGRTPYAYFKSHKIKYAKGYKNGLQKNNGAKQHKQGNQSNRNDKLGKRKAH